MKELFFDLCVFYVETHKFYYQYITKNNIVRYAWINILIHVYKFTDVLILYKIVTI